MYVSRLLSPRAPVDHLYETVCWLSNIRCVMCCEEHEIIFIRATGDALLRRPGPRRRHGSSLELLGFVQTCFRNQANGLQTTSGCFCFCQERCVCRFWLNPELKHRRGSDHTCLLSFFIQQLSSPSHISASEVNINHVYFGTLINVLFPSFS